MRDVPKVSIGKWTQKDSDFSKNMKACMIICGKKYTDMARRAGVSQNTFFCHCREPERMTVKELRAYVQEAKIPEEQVLNFIFQGRGGKKAE